MAATDRFGTPLPDGGDIQDAGLKQRAMDLMRHDVLVKLDLENMFFPPCWNPLTGKLQDHRDDWQITPGLAYCAASLGEARLTEKTV